MSRNLTSAMKSALNKKSGIKTKSKITIYKSRNYISSFAETSGTPAYAPAVGTISEEPIPQDAFYDNENDRLYSIFANPTEEYIEIGTSGSPVICVPCTSGSYVRSPKWHKFSARFPYLYHIDLEGKMWIHEFDPLTLKECFTSGSYNMITSGSPIEPIDSSGFAATSGSSCALVAVDDFELVKLFIDDGGFGIEQIVETSGSWVTNTYEHRFMIPEEVFDDVDASRYMLNYFHSVKRSDGIWSYFSYPSGEVKGIHLDNNGEWSDIFTAIPKDLSVFKIGNAFVDEYERIHLCGQFQRIDEYGAFSSDSIWNLLAWSDDGKTFSIDRNTLFSLMGNRFIVLPESCNLHYMDLNKYYTDTAPYSVIRENTDSLEIKTPLLSVSGSPDSGYTLEMVTTNDALIDHELFVDGNVVKLEMGVNTSGSSIEYVTFDTCMIVSITTDLENGRRALALEILNESLYRLQLFTYPFYLEMQGKQSVYDPIEDMSNLYKAPNEAGLLEPFYIDFWQNEDEFYGGGLYFLFHHTEGEVEIMSGDIKDYMYLSDYPVITELPLTFKIFGWGRIGIPSAAPQVTYDTTPASNPNDDFQAIIKVQHADGTENIITMALEDAITSAYFPQYWKEGNDRLNTGDMPIIYSIGEVNGLVKGDKVMEVGVKASSISPTVFYPERIEIPELVMNIDPSALPQDSHVITEASSYDTVSVEDTTYEFDSSFDGWSQYPYPGDWIAGGTFALGYGGVYLPNTFYHNRAVLYKDFGDLYDVPGAKITYYFKAYGNEWFIPSGDLSLKILYDDSTETTISEINGNYLDFLEEWVWGKEFEISLPGTQKRISRVEFMVMATDQAGAWPTPYPTITYIKFSGFSGIINEENYLDTEDKTALKIKNIGIPNVYFSSKPYSAFNFEASVKVKIKGSYASGGVVGIAEDGQNYICAEMTEDSVSIVKVRDGERTILATTSYSNADTFKRIMLTHSNGDLYVRVQDDLSWGDPILSYRWKYEDGPMATDVDLFHVGIYSLIDAPKFRICSFDPGQSGVIGVLPGCDDSALEDFPSSGKVEIDNVIYKFTHKITSENLKRGPFQVRCCNSWNYDHPDDGEHYEGNSIEIAMFEWQNNPANHKKYSNMILASNAGYGFMIDEIDFKTWITTLSDIVYITNRSRVFCMGLNASLGVSCMDKAYITTGLGGVTVDPDSERAWHQEGAYCYVSNADKIEFTDFYASSSEHDSTVKDLIGKIAKMAGAKALFSGDTVYDSKSLIAGTKENL